MVFSIFKGQESKSSLTMTLVSDETSSQPNYHSIGPSTSRGVLSSSAPNSPMLSSSPAPGRVSPNSLILCVHGNKYGFTQCCTTLEFENQNTSDGSQANLVPNAEEYLRPPTPGEDNVHCHIDRDSGIDKKARNKLIIASIMCIVFMIIEIVGGILAHSLAIATDAVHLMTDFGAFMISLFALYMGSRPATQVLNFGYHRAEVLGALISIMSIWITTGILCYLAGERIGSGDYEIDAEIMMITSGVALIFNIIMGVTLHGPGHGHSHGNEGKSLDKETEVEGTNINVRAAYIHVIGDFVQSIGVFMAAIIIYFKPEWKIADPICTFVFSFIVCFTTLKILRDTFSVLMESKPKGISYEEVRQTFMEVGGIIDIHNLRIWALTTEKSAMVAHLAIDENSSPQNILKEASMKIRQRYNFYDMTLQVEMFQSIMGDCNQCRSPQT